HVVLVLAAIVIGGLGLASSGEELKPPQMDAVEIEGYGGGLGGLSPGPGKIDKGDPGSREGAADGNKGEKQATTKLDFKDIKFTPVKLDDFSPIDPGDFPLDEKGEIDRILKREQMFAKDILKSQPGDGAPG